MLRVYLIIYVYILERLPEHDTRDVRNELLIVL